MTPEKPLHPYTAAYFGFSSISIAGILITIAVPALLIAFLLESANYRGFTELDKQMTAYGGYGAAAMGILLGLTGIVTAVRGMIAATKTGEPAILCDTGLYLGLFATAAWIGCAIAWHSQAWRLIAHG
jgi:hypothetical protein